MPGSDCTLCTCRSLRNLGGTLAEQGPGDETVPAVSTPGVGAVTGASGTQPDLAPPPADSSSPGGPDLQPVQIKAQVAELSQAELTASDGFIYDFSLADVDYIPQQIGLPYENLTALPGVPAADAQVYNNNARSTNPLLTWRLDMLEYNKQLWDRRANRKISDAVRTLIGQVLHHSASETISSQAHQNRGPL